MIELGADPHRILGAHEADERRRRRAHLPARREVRYACSRRALRRSSRIPPGLWEALLPKAKLPLEYELEVEYVDGTFTVRDPYAFLPDLRRSRPASAPRGTARAAVREARRARARDRRRRRHRVRRLGSERALGLGRRRLQLVGRAAASDALARLVRDLGALRPRHRARDEVQVRAAHPGRPARVKADPLAFAAEVPPANASIVDRSTHTWADAEWLERRAQSERSSQPMSIYEVHLGSWRRDTLEGDRSLTYRGARR